MPDSITVTGLVATLPRNLTTSEGLSITSFRLASSQRRFDRGQDKWIDGETNWYTITGFRQLAVNAAASVQKGDRVVVTGRLKIREWQNTDRSGTTIEIEADSLGHDLLWGTSTFTRSVSAAPLPHEAAAAEEFPSAAGQTDDAESSVGIPAPDSAPAASDAAVAESLPVPF